mmetsp:Transcript_60462/g.119802  ORF Transcript_60462/g.119802 Transcript_60462/m.119802 type:complete len:230 (+) Transcript_60462:154-843(+)
MTVVDVLRTALLIARVTLTEAERASRSRSACRTIAVRHAPMSVRSTVGESETKLALCAAEAEEAFGGVSHLKQLHFEAKGTPSRDAAHGHVSVGQRRRDGQDSLPAWSHQRQTLLPPLDDLADFKASWFTAVERRIEFGAIVQCARVVDLDGLLRIGRHVTLADEHLLVDDTGGQNARTVCTSGALEEGGCSRLGDFHVCTHLIRPLLLRFGWRTGNLPGKIAHVASDE